MINAGGLVLFEGSIEEGNNLLGLYHLYCIGIEMFQHHLYQQWLGVVVPVTFEPYYKNI